MRKVTPYVIVFVVWVLVSIPFALGWWMAHSNFIAAPVPAPTPVPLTPTPTATPTPVPPTLPGECVVGGVVVPWMDALVNVGEVALCAANNKLIQVGNIYGPDLDYEEALADAAYDISVWKDCALSITLCPAGFKRSEP